MKDKFKNLNGKATLSVLSIIFVVFVILFTSFWSAGIDLTRWGDKAFISSLLMNTAICIFGILSAIGFGDNYFRTLENGLFQTTYINYNNSRNKINSYVDLFPNWNKQLHEREQKEKNIRYLKEEFGISQAQIIIEYLDITEIANLEKPFMKVIDEKEFYFKTLTQEQIEAVILVMQGKLKIKFIHENYFLNVYSKNSKCSMYELASEEDKRKNRKSFGLISSKILMSIATALIFAGIVIDSSIGAEIGVILINTITRLCVLCGSLYNGYNISSTLVKFDVEFINYKIQILDTFYLEVVEHKTVVAITEEEEAKLEYEKEKENEEVINN